MAAERDDSAVDRWVRGCAESFGLWLVAALTLIACGFLHNVVGAWIMYAWFVFWLIVFSWRAYGPWGAAAYLVMAAIGWMAVLEMRAG